MIHMEFDFKANGKPIGRGKEDDKQKLINAALTKGLITERDTSTIEARMVKFQTVQEANK